jgi:PAS domain S-box-containing protein
MIRKLLRILGAVKTSLTITAVSILSSALLYIIISIFLARITVIGVLMSMILPAIVAPFVSYFFVRLLLQLDLAERELVKANAELESRVKQRTAELVRANETLRAEIAERKQAEAALRESEERYRLHFENVTDVVYSITPELRVLGMSPSVERHLGYRPEELIGRPLQDLNLLAPEYLEAALSDTLRVLAGERIDSAVYEFIARDGTRKLGEVSGAPLFREGEVVAVVAVARDISERVRAEEQIKASLREKEVLLKEIHHRVKNNLQVISSMLYLQSKNIQDRQTIEMFQESQYRVRSMALVHEWLYQSPDLARIDFAEYVRSLANHLFQSYGVNANVIQLKINVDDVSLGVNTAIPCGLIINELVSNSLKHAFSDGREGEICIEVRVDRDGKHTLMVSDNGVGFPEDLDFRDAGSLGLQLVNTLVDQLEGTIELDRSGGTAFKIMFTEPGNEEGG